MNLFFKQLVCMFFVRLMAIFLLITTSFAGDYWNFDQHPKQNTTHTSLMKSMSDLLFNTGGSPKTSSPRQDIVRKANHSTERNSSAEYANGIFIDSEVWSPPRNISGVSYASFLEGEEGVVTQNGLTAALLDSNDKKLANGNNDRLSGSSSSSGESLATIVSQNSPPRRDMQRNASYKANSEEKIVDCCCLWFFCRTEE